MRYVEYKSLNSKVILVCYFVAYMFVIGITLQN